MPSFEGKISEEEILQIIAYIKSLGENDRKEYR
jgi:mono/diheme cytochrome c family protein